MACLLEGGLDSWSGDGLRTQQVQVPYDLFDVSWVGLILDALRGPSDNPVEDLDFFVIRRPWAKTTRLGKLIFLFHSRLHPVEVTLWPG